MQPTAPKKIQRDSPIVNRNRNCNVSIDAAKRIRRTAIIDFQQPELVGKVSKDQEGFSFFSVFLCVPKKSIYK